MSSFDNLPEGGPIVVTGAGGDLAGTVVARLAGRGRPLALTVRPGSVEAARARYSQALEDASQVHVYGVDLASATSVAAGFERVRDELGTPAALVHLAGRFESGPAADAGVEAAATALERSLDGNLRSAVYAAAAVLPGLLAAGKGAVVAVGAAAAKAPAPGSVAYAAGKGALAAYFRSLAAQVARHGVSVGLVMPMGALDTPGNRRAMPNADPSAWISAEAFAEAVEYLLGRRARAFVHELPLSAS